MLNDEYAAERLVMSVGEPQNLKARTKSFALRVITLYNALPKTTVAQTLGRQVLRSGTAVGAHYRESCRSRSNAEFIAKIELALQELEETTYWFELLADSNSIPSVRLSDLMKEADEIAAMLVASVKTVKSKR